ncbi:MAG: hypothetical protein L6Q99_09970 [Planctomycetes bacterium]|nr:hypothetical protein [Planctomycetota bacterium]
MARANDALAPAARQAGATRDEAAPARRAALRTPGDWRALFHGGDSRRVLARLMQDDPLGLRERVGAKLEARAYLLDADRVLLRSFARTARAASGYHGDPPLARWLDERIDEAVGDLVTEDFEAERTDAPLDERQATAYATLGGPLGFAPAELRAACVGFNRLPESDRRAFHALVIRGRSLDELARERGESASEVGRAARRGLDALLRGADSRRPDPTRADPKRADPIRSES